VSEEIPKTFTDNGDIGVFYNESTLLRGYRTRCYQWGHMLSEGTFDDRAVVVEFQKMNEDGKEDGAPLLYHRDSLDDPEAGWTRLEPPPKEEEDEDSDVEYSVEMEVPEDKDETEP
jgi:hypothetical protein